MHLVSPTVCNLSLSMNLARRPPCGRLTYRQLSSVNHGELHCSTTQFIVALLLYLRIEAAQECQQRGIDLLCPFQREPMAGPVEHSVASEVGDIVFEAGEGVRQYDECGVLATDHEVARLGDLGMRRRLQHPPGLSLPPYPR